VTGRGGPLLRVLRARAEWLVYGVVALACTVYLNARAELVTKWGEWYMATGVGHSYVLLQVRAFLSGRLAVLTSSLGATPDCDWGRGGMHQQWGLGLPILATPFHLLGRLFGAPGFPDDVRFLIFFAATAVVLSRALHKLSPCEPGCGAASAVAAGFVMVFPTFVGMVSSRFRIFEQTIAMGALWCILLLAVTLALLDRCTPARLYAASAAAGFATMLRPPLAIYGVTTLAIGLLVARRRGLRPIVLIGGVASYAAMSALYFVGNVLRFGSPLVAGFENCLSGYYVNRLNRYGLPFAQVPFRAAAKEMFATLFLLDPVGSHTMTPPASVQPYVVGERWREYYSPTFDKVILAVWLASLVVVSVRIARGKLWRSERDPRDDVASVIAVWAAPPVLVLFVFYARIGNMVTRYATDMAPAFAAAALSVGVAIVDVVRKRAPERRVSVQIAIAGVVALYIAGWRGWTEHMTRPVTREQVLADLAGVDARERAPLPSVPRHFECGRPVGPSPVITHFEDWHPDCTFASGMVFAMPHDRCVSFTLRPKGATWESEDTVALAGFRAKADFDTLVSCGPPVVDGEARRVTLCDPHPPAFLLEGIRLYSVAALDPKLYAVDRLKLMRVDATRACP
jgi:hypothetical protein